MSTRGVPVQDLLENQDETTLYNVDEVTGVVTPLAREARPASEKKSEKKSPTRRTPAAKEASDAAKGEGE